MQKIISVALLIISLVSLNAFANGEIKQAVPRCGEAIEEQQIPRKGIESSLDPSAITPQMIKEKRDEIEKIALENGISKETAKIAQTLIFDPKVALLEVRQPERMLSFREYYEKTMPDYKILDAKKFLIDNWDELEKIEKQFKVEKEVIVALILIETYLGKVLGTFNIMDSLFTLSLTSYRPEFWQKELLHTFALTEGKKTLYNRETKGSWAGAVGLVQFIPSSFIKLAKDGDGDGIIDTVANKMDAYASAGNYLKEAGWKYQTPYIRKVNLSLTDEEFCQKAGKAFEDGFLVFPDRKNTESVFVAHKNFSVVLLWNRSLFFSTTVGLVYNELKNVSKNHP